MLHHEYLPATEAAQQELVLLHGWGCNREIWRPMLARFRPWANVTLLDVPGCGPGLAGGTTPELHEVLAQILRCSPPRAVYVGWSLGGQLALELAAMAPERVTAVVTTCSNPRFIAAPNWPGMDAEVFAQFRAKVEVDPVSGLQRFDSLMVAGSTQPRVLLRQLRQLHLSGHVSPSGLNWLEALDQRELLGSLTQPRFHLFAKGDALVPCAVAQLVGAHASRQSAKTSVLQNCSHVAPLEAPAELSDEIHGFLAHAGLLDALPSAVPELEKKEVAASFSRAASRYDSVARLQRDVGEHLLTYVDALPIAPTNVLDLGCGTGYFRAALAERYPDVQYLGLDLAEGMVSYARHQCGDDAATWLVADAESLPLERESVDLVFSSLALQWCSRLEHVFAELARVLRPGGRCVFTSLGPQTLHELRDAWAAADAHQHVNTFAPVEALTAAAQRIPELNLTLECRAFRMEYTRVGDLLDELKVLGAHNMNRRRPAGLTSRRALQTMLAAYDDQRVDGVLPATYDVIFGRLEKIAEKS